MRLITLFLVAIAVLAGAFAVLTVPLLIPPDTPAAGTGRGPGRPAAAPRPGGGLADEKSAAPLESGRTPPGQDGAGRGQPGEPAGRRPQLTDGMTGGPVADDRVHWAADSGRRELAQRLEKAAATLATDPYHATALRDAAAAAAGLGHWTTSADYLRRLRELEPQDAELRFQLAATLMRLRRFVEAIPLLHEQVAERADDRRAWFNLAVAHQALGHLSEARAAWDHAIELHPGDVEALARRGEVLLDLHEWAAAAADFGAALKLDPESIDGTLNLALAWQRSGRRADARALLLDLLSRQPRNVHALRRLVDISREELELDAGNQAARQDAVNFGRRLLEIVPDEPQVRELLERVEER